MNKTKTNKGITLVALVITIIVLIILAGVSINAVMNQGLINNAKNATSEFEVAKQNEVEKLTVLEGYITDEKDNEVIADFEKAKIEEYIFKNSYLTGIELGTTVADLDLPGEYKLCNVDGTDITNTATKVATGMMLKKNNKEVGRTIIYGDVSCDGEMYIRDSSDISSILSGKDVYEDYQKIAADVNHDNVVDLDDANIINEILADIQLTINQSKAAPNIASLKFEKIDTLGRVVNSFKSDKYTLVWDDDEGCYVLSGVTKGTQVSEIIAEFTKNINKDFIVTNSSDTILEGEIEVTWAFVKIRGHYANVGLEDRLYDICEFEIAE